MTDPLMDLLDRKLCLLTVEMDLDPGFFEKCLDSEDWRLSVESGK